MEQQTTNIMLSSDSPSTQRRGLLKKDLFSETCYDLLLLDDFNVQPKLREFKSIYIFCKQKWIELLYQVDQSANQEFMKKWESWTG